MYDPAEITYLCFLACALAAAPGQAHEIIDFTLIQLPPRSKVRRAVVALERALNQQPCDVDTLRAAADSLAHSPAPAAKTIGEILGWALT